MKKIIIPAILFIIVVTMVFYTSATIKKPGFEDKRAKLLADLDSNIREAVLEGKYNCCIEPPCTMCYLGNWIWEDGTCHCDEMIAQGELDKVCPQCRQKVGEGQCNSTTAHNHETNLFLEAVDTK